ncbi:MAG: hypothetical protein WBW69_23850 [Candidatus Korobacteraceae bacterium]
MKTSAIMRTDQLERFARFLKEHPGFSPLLQGEDAAIFGFQTGHCVLTLGEMERLVAAEPHFDAEQAALLLSTVARRG